MCVYGWPEQGRKVWAHYESLVNVFTNFAHEGGTSAAVVYGATNISLALLEWNLIFYIIFYKKSKYLGPPHKRANENDDICLFLLEDIYSMLAAMVLSLWYQWCL